MVRWVADHRRHHKYSDQEGDPHSPWAYGPGVAGLTGLYHAHMGWLFSKDRTSRSKYAPDLLKDRDIRFLSLDPVYALIVLSTFLVPMGLGALLTFSWHGALTALFWAGLMRVFVGEHVTFSINSICHVFGKEDFKTRDKARNVWWLAIPSFGSPGTTCTTPTRPARGTASSRGRSTSARGSSGSSRSSAGSGTSAGPTTSASPPARHVNRRSSMNDLPNSTAPR